ncbi:hypothetical protein ACFWBX_23590 [Streptomyces sp. NPDC059991]|uniref:hypothetical protein n=1 Tax=Streptomyces sp. NPDC059991 TaxID=3347028 RepID=UPI0036C4F92B
MDVTALTTLVAVPSALLGLATAYYQFRRARSETRRTPAQPRRRGAISGVTVDTATAARTGALFGREDEMARLRAWTGGADRCVSTFHAPRVYERLDLRGVRGLSARQLEALSALGAMVG